MAKKKKRRESLRGIPHHGLDSCSLVNKGASFCWKSVSVVVISLLATFYLCMLYKQLLISCSFVDHMDVGVLAALKGLTGIAKAKLEQQQVMHFMQDLLSSCRPIELQK